MAMDSCVGMRGSLYLVDTGQVSKLQLYPLRARMREGEGEGRTTLVKTIPKSVLI